MLVSYVLKEPQYHEDVWGSGGKTPRILNLGLNWGEWSALCPYRFNPRETASNTRRIGGCVGLRSGLDAVVKRKFACSSPNQTPIVQPAD
jgi:hypothetical protein